MTDYIFPTHARVSAEQLAYIAGSVGERSIFTGAVRTTSRSGSRLRFGISTTNASDREDYSNKAALQALIGQLDGQSNRLLFADPGYVRRGSFSASELLTNNTFANGTTGWTQLSPTFTVADRVARLTRTMFTASVDTLSPAAAITGLTQYAPYVCRCFDVIGRGTWIPGVQLGSAAGTNDYGISTASGGGMKTLMVVVPATSAHFGLVDFQLTDNQAGDYYEVPYTSMARCALVDGGVNMFTHSDSFDNAAWTKTASSITANSIANHLGATTADDLVDTGASTTHSVQETVTVPTAADDMVMMIAVKARNRNWCSLEFSDGSTTARSTFDLANGLSGVNGGTGASWSNRRQFIDPLGSGWYRVTMVARKSAGVTSVTCRIYSANGDGVETYAGSSNAAIAIFRATKSISGVPGRLKETTTTASTGETQIGNTLHMKGLPPSTAGLLLPGDRVQVGTQKNIVTAPLNSDASGLGYLRVAARWRTSPADNAPVIIHQPFGRFVQASPETGWDQQPGGLSNYELQIEEALDG